jgi:hypothetical protein
VGIIKMGYEGGNWMKVVQDRVQWRISVVAGLKLEAITR